MLAGGDEAREVSHVDHQQRADRVGDLPEAGEVELARIGRPAGEDQLRAELLGEARQRVHVDARVVVRHAIGDDVVEAAGEVEPHAVGEVAAVVELHAEDAVAGLEQRVERGGVGLGARVRLDVRVLGAE